MYPYHSKDFEYPENPEYPEYLEHSEHPEDFRYSPKKYIERGKLLVLLFFFATSVFFFLAIKDREAKIIYEGRAGERKIEQEENREVQDKERVFEEQDNKEQDNEGQDNEEKDNEEKDDEEKDEEKQDRVEKKANFAEENTAFKKEIQLKKESISASKININTATAKELESLKGIGPATAKNIISYREEYGGFSSIEEIMNVKRIGEKTFAKIQDQISVE